MVKTIGTGDKTDFDETRRLLYMALLVPRTKRYNLAGTLVNALKHHHAVDGLDAGMIADHVVAAVNGGDAPTEAEHQSREWLQAQIDRITEELGD
jgi:hypothetical protein